MQSSDEMGTNGKVVTRRRFIGRCIGVLSTAVSVSILYPVIRFLIPPSSGEAKVNQVKLPFGRAEIAADPKRAKTFRFGRQLGIIVLMPGGELRAFSAQCTHLDCTVQNRPEEGVLWCACHNGRYDLNGKNISGPPPRPLEVFAVNEGVDGIHVSKEAT